MKSLYVIVGPISVGAVPCLPAEIRLVECSEYPIDPSTILAPTGPAPSRSYLYGRVSAITGFGFIAEVSCRTFGVVQLGKGFTIPDVAALETVLREAMASSLSWESLEAAAGDKDEWVAN